MRADFTQTYKWNEILKHSERSSRWIVIEKRVYDVTSWSKKHPGGSPLLGHVAGQDATEAFRAFHAGSMETTVKYLKPLQIGVLDPNEPEPEAEIREDFEHLRKTAQNMGLFKSNKWFFYLMFAHCVILDILSYVILYKYGTGWTSLITSLLLQATSQAQLGWYQHDAGHLSIFKKSSHNRVFHTAVICFMKGASHQWWNHMHYQHHCKPNVIGKDPDVRLEQLFVVGDEMPLEVAQNEEQNVPYNHQHKYFFIIGPPLLFPVYFQFMTFRHVYTRKLWLEGILMVTFYIRMVLQFNEFFGFFGSVLYFQCARVIESIWFTWVSQSNHIPMAIEKDEPKGKSWLKTQLHATCNIEKSAFNDWFTGHLNFQCEHHLFPTMPRHNYYKIAPLVKSLCEKHGIEYKVKPLLSAFCDIVQSLKKSGAIWLHAYEELHVHTN